jgi:hypothetical protein
VRRFGVRLDLFSLEHRLVLPPEAHGAEKKTFGPAWEAEGLERTAGRPFPFREERLALGFRGRSSGLRIVLLGPAFPSRFLGPVAFRRAFRPRLQRRDRGGFSPPSRPRFRIQLSPLLYFPRASCQAISLAAAKSKTKPGRASTLRGDSAAGIPARRALSPPRRGLALAGGAAQENGTFSAGGCHGLLAKPCAAHPPHRLTSNRWHPWTLPLFCGAPLAVEGGSDIGKGLRKTIFPAPV